MEREHEELMRSDFREQTTLTRSVYDEGVTDAQAQQISAKTEQIDQRWSDGPHSQQWQFLSDAYADWRDRPETMARHLDTVEHNRAQGWDTLDEVQYRSLMQARELTAPDREQDRTRGRGRGQISRER
ncbi:hypothetical protein [Nocardia jejuensis]|uniref:hypothetical protein n=1 Tax=Nocardia jejuensis TaxID=328049 RepID=UPI000A7A3764|nr:hypothetical protein [Nocardia jejuensis]